MLAFELDDLRQQGAESGNMYLEFLRVPSLSVGLYSLPAGAVDPQLPHTEDEVYYIVRGRGYIQVGDEDRAVQAGSVVYVAKLVEHRFHDISEDLDIIVFFSPAEYSARAEQ
jgi:mannose-6-phosphate isomerase-like protein (cupin superfamily)